MILTDKNTLSNWYIRKQIQKYKKRKTVALSNDIPVKGIAFRRIIHPLLVSVLRIKSILLGLTYEIIGERKETVKGKTVIYAITHIGKYDLEMIYEACNFFAYVFAGDWELMYATIDDYFLRLKGVLWIDTSDKADRRNSFQYMVKLLNQGVPMIIFPEGIWNLTESLPMMKIFPGVVQAAKTCNVPIVPIAIEQVEKHFVINIGQEMQVSDLEESVALQNLRDMLASLKWEIWEYLPQEKRSNISEDYYESFLQKRISECDGFSVELVNDRMYKDETDRELLAIKNDLEKLRN